ncbi:MAG: flagellar biosynthesis protein FlgI, partial [Planctomycetota bacterium]
ALEALRGLKHHDVKPALAGLFADASLEIRYGAFDALRRRETPSDAARDDRPFELFELTGEGSPAIVASLRNRAEIVVFGNASPLNIQTVFRGPAGWMIRETQTPGKVRLTRFRTGADDVRIEIDNTVGGLLGGMVQAGGSYGDAIAMLRMAKTSDVLIDPLAFDPLPEGQRKYLRDGEATDVD